MTNPTSYASVGYYNDDFISAMGWSLPVMKAGIDRLKQAGFTGVDFDLSVPYDRQGNLLTLKYQNLVDLTKYCRDQGLQASVHLNSVLDYDNAAYVGSFGHSLAPQNIHNFFGSMKQFFEVYGPIFQGAGLDVISVGGSNVDIMGINFHDYWASAIGELKKGYHGLVTYQADSIKKGVDYSTLNDIGIWDLLDAATVWLKPYISEVPLSNYLDVLQGYYFDKNHQSILDELTNFVQAKHLPLILQFNAMALDNALDGGWDPTPAQVTAGNIATNYVQQALAYQAFFDFVANHLGSELSSELLALQVGNFSLAPDNSPLGKFGMSNFPEPATTEFVKFLKDSAAYCPSHVVQGGPSSDTIYLSASSNVAQLNGGFDTVVGSPANDTIIFSPLINFAELSGDISAWIDSQSIEFTIQVKENGRLIDTIKLPLAQVTALQVNTWVSFPSIHVKLPTSLIPRDLELSLMTNTGTGFVSATNFKIYWLGDKPISLTSATQLGDNAYALATANPNLIVANGGKRVDLSGLNLSFNNPGATTIKAGVGTDTVAFTGASTDYVITKSTTPSQLSVFDKRSDGNGPSVLQDIERLQFSDKTVALDISGTAGQAYRIYQAAFNRTPDNGGLKYWIGLMDGGVSLPTVSSAFIASAEFKTLYGSNPTNELFVSKLYDNVLHRTPDIGGYNYWVGLLNTKKIDNISTLINFSESTENQAGVIGVIQNGIELLN